MKELSLNILDIAMNSVKAGASIIEIRIDESTDGFLTFAIADNGCGMTAEQVAKLSDPFFTSRKTRKVGLGIPFLKLAAEQTGGSVTIESRAEAQYPDDHGTVVTAVFKKDHIDFTPLGDIISTLITLIQGSPAIDFIFWHKVDCESEVSLSTIEMKQVLGEDIPLDSFEILDWIKSYLEEQYSTAQSK